MNTKIKIRYMQNMNGVAFLLLALQNTIIGWIKIVENPVFTNYVAITMFLIAFFFSSIGILTLLMDTEETS